MFANWMRKNKADENKIKALVSEREETRKRIRKQKDQMDGLIRKAAEADELDRRIYSADYRTTKEQFLAEMQHFEDLSRLINQLRNAGLTRERAAALEKIVAVSDAVDRDQLIANEDYVSARREMMAEEDERFRDALEDHEPERFDEEDAEFTRLVARAQAENVRKTSLPDLSETEFPGIAATE